MGEKSKRQSRSTGTEQVQVVEIGPSLTIQQAEELRLQLIAAFAGGAEVRLNVADVAEADLAGLQLLCSAHRSSIQHNKSFGMASTCSEAILNVARDAGFLRHIGCAPDVNKTCLWTGRG